MTDPFSIVSGAAGIVSLGLTIAKALFLVADGIGSAGVEVRSHAEEIDSFSKLLNHVRTKLDDCPSIYPEIRSLVGEVVRICDKVLTPLHNLRQHLEPLSQKFKRSPNRFKQLGMRMEWVFRDRNKILFYRDALKQQHGVLDTILGLITLQMVKNCQQKNMNLLQLGLENSLAALDHAYRANQQGFPDPELQGPSFGPGPKALITDTGSDYSPTEARSLMGGRPETVIACNLASPDDSDEDLSEQGVHDAIGNIVHGYESVPPSTVEQIRNDVGALQRSVLRLSAKIKAETDLGTDGPEMDPSRCRTVLVCTSHLIYVAVMSVLDRELRGMDATLSTTENVYTEAVLGGHRIIVAYMTGKHSTLRDGLKCLLSALQQRYRQTALSVMTLGLGIQIPRSEKDIRLGDVVVSAPWNSSQGIVLVDKRLGWSYTITNSMGNPSEGQPSLHTPWVAAAKSLAVRHEIRGNRLHVDLKSVLQEFSGLNKTYGRPRLSTDRKSCGLYVPQPGSPHDECKTCQDPRSKHRVQKGEPVFFSQVHLETIAIPDSTWEGAPHEVLEGYLKGEIAGEASCFAEVARDILVDFPCLVICGICQYGDSDSSEHEIWEGYAAMAAAAYAKNLLLHLHEV